MHDRTITLFNLHKPPGAEGTWYPTVFQGVTLHDVRAGTASADSGTQNADTVEAVIPVLPDQSSVDTAGTVRRYVGPKAYAALEDPAGYFTFTPEQDFFAAGDLTSESVWPPADDDYDEGFYNAMNRERDGVYKIASSAFYSLLPHFEIGGR